MRKGVMGTWEIQINGFKNKLSKMLKVEDKVKETLNDGVTRRIKGYCS